ncbi:hypothetical protein F5X68DRAFT_253904 [Plectosphaerella plurivora]|uniref:Nephrocystin 3-like N-terminal domain-containing protein n=1 Tax=Plectosphaerella plurivora TaxID=936078 RepID=A0A9P8VDA7_9PEZI|nr:hypothetical protein F5X68DRAFT_253904 [Plectosphaerella plurivora]
MEAAGLASAIIAFIEFSCKLVNGTVDAYKKSGTAVDPHISNVIHDLQDVSSDMTANLTPPPVASQTGAVAFGTHEQKLQALAAKCKTLSDELVNVLKDLERKTDGIKLWRSVQAAWKALRKSEKITEIEQKLNTYRLELLLRLNMMLADKDASIKLQLNQMEDGNKKSFHDAIYELASIRESIKKLDANLQAQTRPAIHSSVMDLDLDQVSALRDIRTELARITKSLETLQLRSSPDLQILTRLRFDCVHTRFDAIVDGEFDDFMRLLRTDLDPCSYTQSHLDVEEHTRRALHRWFIEGDKVLHISGKAGSGKSTLMKLLSRDESVRTRLLDWAGTKKLVIAKFFFWLSDKNTHQNSLQGLYRSILLDILQQCPELTKIVFPRQWDETSARDGLFALEKAPFRLIELQDAMNKLVKSFPGGSDFRFVFFIDGLDEYAAASTDHKKLATQLQSWAAQSADVKICASSRPHQEFHAVFSENARINLHDLTRPDIRRFCERMLETENDGYLSRDQISELAYGIESRADGVFLWARLVTDILCQGILHLDQFHTLKRRISQAPEELMDLFLFLFDQISSVDRTQAYRLLLLAISDIEFDANALMVSWVEKLHDPDFPYNAPRATLTETEDFLK